MGDVDVAEEREGQPMNKLLIVERDAADKLLTSIRHAMLHPTSNVAAGTPLETQLSINGYLRALTFALDHIVEYRRTLLLAIAEEKGA